MIPFELFSHESEGFKHLLDEEVKPVLFLFTGHSELVPPPSDQFPASDWLKAESVGGDAE